MRIRSPRRKVLGILICLPLAAASQSGVPKKPKDSWLIVEGQDGDHNEIVTLLDKPPDLATRKKFPVLLKILWGYKALANGMPSEDELVYARKLYAGIDAVVGADGMYVMTRTGGGSRTMFYYVRDAEPLKKAIAEFFDAEPPLSVKVVAQAEPTWESFQNMRGLVKK